MRERTRQGRGRDALTPSTRAGKQDTNGGGKELTYGWKAWRGGEKEGTRTGHLRLTRNRTGACCPRPLTNLPSGPFSNFFIQPNSPSPGVRGPDAVLLIIKNTLRSCHTRKCQPSASSSGDFMVVGARRTASLAFPITTGDQRCSRWDSVPRSAS